MSPITRLPAPSVDFTDGSRMWDAQWLASGQAWTPKAYPGPEVGQSDLIDPRH